MSDVVRNYTGQGGFVTAVKRRRRGPGLIRRVFFPLMLILVIAFAWMTRDSYSVTQCMPGGQRICLVIADPVHARERISQSRVLGAIPPGSFRDNVTGTLNFDSGIPDWILNNLFFERLYVLANDTHEFSDVLALSRMTRIGVLLERLHAFVPGIENDYAGGLRLRYVEDPHLYYAVRGRIILLSPSREALIHALTLAKDQVVDATTIADLTQGGAEDIRGTLTLDPKDTFGDLIQSIAFAVRVDSNGAQGKFRGRLRPDSRSRFGPLLDGATPVSLAAPPEGMVELSADFGKPVRDVWASLGQLFRVDWLSKAQWDAWENPKAEGPPTVSQLVTGLVGDAGPGIRLSLVGVDVNEMIPMPLLAGTLDATAAQRARLQTIPSPPDGTMPWDSYPRYDADAGLAYLPMIGGPSLEPAAAPLGDALLVCSSRETTATLKSGAQNKTPLPSKGNLFIRIHPGPVVENLVECGRLLTEFDGLRGYDKESFNAAAESWQEAAAAIDQVTTLASVKDTGLEVELRVACAAPAEAQ